MPPRRWMLCLAVALALAAFPAAAQTMGAGFTYQGRLEAAGAPADGAYDMKFTLYDAETGGAMIGATVTASAVDVVDGAFSVVLDFGTDAFSGDARWLLIEVRSAGAAAYTTLSPRQRVRPTPYAIQSLDALRLGGRDASAYALAGGGGALADVLTVSRSGGDFTTVQAAIDSVTTASADARVLVSVGPGVYAETVSMKPFVDVEGAGRALTIIRSGGFSTSAAGTVAGADDCELRKLTVENTGGADYAVGIYNNDAAMRIQDVAVRCDDADVAAYGIRSVLGSLALVENVDVRMLPNSEDSTAILNDASSVRLFNVNINCDGARDTSNGVYSTGVCQPLVSEIVVNMLGADSNVAFWTINDASLNLRNALVHCQGGTNAVGLGARDTNDVQYSDLRIVVEDATYNYACYSDEASVSLKRAVLVSRDAPNVNQNYGLYNAAAAGIHKVEVNGSRILTPGVTIFNDDDYEVYLGVTQMTADGIDNNGGLIRAVGCYDEHYQSAGYTAVP